MDFPPFAGGPVQLDPRGSPLGVEKPWEDDNRTAASIASVVASAPIMIPEDMVRRVDRLDIAGEFPGAVGV